MEAEISRSKWLVKPVAAVRDRPYTVPSRAPSREDRSASAGVSMKIAWKIVNVAGVMT